MFSLESICHWLQHTEWSQYVLQSTLLFPIIEGTHIMALSISIGLILILDIRLLGLGFRGERVSVIMKQSAGWSTIGFGVIIFTGLVLFVTQAEKAYHNPFFLAKMLLLIAALANAAWFQHKYFPKMAEWDLAQKTPFGPRMCALVSLICWIGVIGCGRTMAYEF